MAALSSPELPEMSRTGTPRFPELPAPPLGGGENGNGKRGGWHGDLSALDQHNPRPLARMEAGALRGNT